MELLLIRHGQSEADLLDVHEGRANFPLTDLGVEQATQLASWVSVHYPLECIWTSPLLRARHVADTLAASIGIPVFEHVGLTEWDNGVLAGLSRDDARVRYPEPFGGRKPHEAVLGGESQLQFRHRVEAAFNEIMNASKACGRIAIVSHGGTISHMIAVFLKLPGVTGYQFRTDDTGCHLLVTNGVERWIRFLNRQDHLLRNTENLGVVTAMRSPKQDRR